MAGTVSHSSQSTPTLTDFIAAIYHFAGDSLLEFRALPSKKTAFIRRNDAAGLRAFARRDENLYIGVASRKDSTSGAATNLHELLALFVDIDFKGINETDARARLAAFRLPPTALIQSGGGLHPWWALATPLDVTAPEGCARAKALLRRLATALGGDLAAAEPARILRLPDSRNHKYDPHRPVVIEALDAGRRYTLDEIEACVPVSAVTKTATKKNFGATVGEGGRNARLTSQAGAMQRRGMAPAAIEAALLVENTEKCNPPLAADEVRAIARSITRYGPNDEDDEDKPRRSQATEIIELVKDKGIELWHTPNGDPFATLALDGHREHHPLTRVVRDYVARVYFHEYKRAASSAAMTDATATLTGMAKFDGAEHPVAVRLAGHNGALYLDLGTPEWVVVEITAADWQVTTTAPVRHWRPRSLRPLPAPVRGGSLNTLRELWPNITDEAWTLIVAWLVATLLPGGPFPILVLVGEQGSGKSTLGKMIRGLIDPASPALRGVPRDERDVVIGGATNYIVALDNLSGLPVWLSDSLCRIATGGGFATRQLFTDADELTLDVTRPILLTGIDSPASRGDLLDRALVVSLPAMTDEQRGEEAALWLRYEALRPALLGALLDAAVCALKRRDQVTLVRKPRMADACTWVTAAEPALGWNDQTTVTAWLGSRQTASEDLVAGDLVAQALTALTAAYTGSFNGLLTMLNGTVSEVTQKARDWPATPRKLSSALRRLAPDLRRLGLAIELPDDVKAGRDRVVTITPPDKRRKTQDEQDTQGGSEKSGRNLEAAPSPVCPVSRPIAPTGQQQDNEQDTLNANVFGPLSDVSGVSCLTHLPSGDDAGENGDGRVRLFA